jgi:hypothetical protein
MVCAATFEAKKAANKAVTKAGNERVNRISTPIAKNQ